LALMLAVECAEINHLCEEAYRAMLAQPTAAPAQAWDIPTPVFNSVTSQIGELDQAAEIVAMYSAVSAAIRLGVVLSGRDHTDPRFQPTRRNLFGNLTQVLDRTAALLPLLKETARDAHISTDMVLEAPRSAQIGRSVEVETGKAVDYPT
jgi:hypothetical protein